MTLTLRLHKGAANRRGLRALEINPWGVAGLFARNDYSLAQGGGASGAALLLTQPLHAAAARFGTARRALPPQDWRARLREWADEVDLTPDLGSNIGSLSWWRGAATCVGLCFTAILLRPQFQPIPAIPDAPIGAAAYDEFRSQMITPLALGADSGRHMGPTEAVTPLTDTPERPMIELSAAVGAGDGFRHALGRAGVRRDDIDTLARLLGSDVAPGSLSAGTRLAITLGRRPNRNVARPLDALAFRARLDLAVEVKRENGALTVHRTPIAVDNTPLRIRGVITDSIYRAARASGALPSTIQSYLRVIGQQISLDRIRAGDRFDIIIAHRRAATGETETGELLYGGLKLSSGRKIDMLQWRQDGKSQWFEASGVGQKRPGLAKPVNVARLSSGFGMRFHPILGYSRLHAGVDYAAPTGTPIHAVSEGRVTFAGRNGGHGNYVKLAHSGGLSTGYAHMSRIAVDGGERVKRGQIIGYVGSTGLSTGPHLHYEVYRNGRAINPTSVKFEQQAQLAGRELQAFRARLAELKSIANSPDRASDSATATAETAKRVAQVADSTKASPRIALR